MALRTFALVIEPAPSGLEALGEHRVELHEMGLGALKRAIADSPDGFVGEFVLSRVLWVDGEPIGFEALMDLPGRFSQCVNEAMARCMVLHTLRRATTSAAPEPSLAEEEATAGEP